MVQQGNLSRDLTNAASENAPSELDYGLSDEKVHIRLGVVRIFCRLVNLLLLIMDAS